MIGKIQGTLLETEGNVGLVSTGTGISYEVYLPPTLLSSILPKEVDIYTHLVVREDSLTLFGFDSRQARTLFNLLLTVSGVGPKSAYAIMASGTTDALIKAVRANEVEFFSKVSGVGKKTGIKIILELSQKLAGEFDLEKLTGVQEDSVVVEALVSLGYRMQDIKKVLKDIPPDLSIEDQITLGLQKLSK